MAEATDFERGWLVKLSACVAAAAGEDVRAFAGQEVDGAWFGRSGRLTLPTFTQVVPYRSADGQVEVDVLAEAVSGERWAVELKWQNKVGGEKI